MDDSSWLSPDELRVFRAFSRLSRHLFVQFDQELQRDVGMPRTYFEILWFLRAAPDRSLRMSDLAELTGSQPSRISHAVGRLEEAGFVERELCAADRRGWFTVLTGKGTEALSVAAPCYARSIREHLLAPLSATEKEQLVAIAETILEPLGQSATTDRPKTASTRKQLQHSPSDVSTVNE